MALTLYGGARTRASMPRWYMEEKGIAYDWRMLDMRAGEHSREPFLSINPFGKLPALVHEAPEVPGGRLQLFESGAILLYLAELSGECSSSAAAQPGGPMGAVCQRHLGDGVVCSQQSGEGVSAANGCAQRPARWRQAPDGQQLGGG